MKRINILITDEQHKRLLERSKKTEISISEQIRTGINIYLFDRNKYTDMQIRKLKEDAEFKK